MNLIDTLLRIKFCGLSNSEIYFIDLDPFPNMLVANTDTIICMERLQKGIEELVTWKWCLHAPLLQEETPIMIESHKYVLPVVTSE